MAARQLKKKQEKALAQDEYTNESRNKKNHETPSRSAQSVMEPYARARRRARMAAAGRQHVVRLSSPEPSAARE